MVLSVRIVQEQYTSTDQSQHNAPHPNIQCLAFTGC